jgi:hypothetical protein
VAGSPINSNSYRDLDFAILCDYKTPEYDPRDAQNYAAGGCYIIPFPALMLCVNLGLVRQHQRGLFSVSAIKVS